MGIRLILIVLFIASAASVCLGQKRKKPTVRTIRVPVLVVEKHEDESWAEYSNDDAALTISFPKSPETTKLNTREFAGGRVVNVENVTMQAFINGDYFMVSSNKYPPKFLINSPDLALGFGVYMKLYILSGVNVLHERVIPWGKYSMVEFVYVQTAGEVIVHRAVVVGDTLYQLICQLRTKAGEKPDAAVERLKERLTKFFDSLRIKEEQVMDIGVG